MERQNRAFPVDIFLSYAPEDDDLCQQLEMHLRPLQREGKIAMWHRHEILGGSERQQSIKQHLDTADIILLLVSPYFIASDECYDVEMRRALERHRAGQTLAMPVILRHVDWQTTALADLPCLPRDGKPVAAWPDRHEAFRHIVDEVRDIIMRPDGAAISQGDHEPEPGDHIRGDHIRGDHKGTPLQWTNEPAKRHCRGVPSWSLTRRPESPAFFEACADVLDRRASGSLAV